MRVCKAYKHKMYLVEDVFDSQKMIFEKFGQKFGRQKNMRQNNKNAAAKIGPDKVVEGPQEAGLNQALHLLKHTTLGGYARLEPRPEPHTRVASCLSPSSPTSINDFTGTDVHGHDE